MRVALLSMHSSPGAKPGSTDVGGMNLYVRRLADGLSAAGIATDIFTRRTDTLSPEIVETEGGARLIHLSAGPRRRLPKSVLPLHIPAMAAAFRAFTARESAQYDILHSHYWISGLVAARCRAGVREPTPFVHMFHTLSKLKEFHVGLPDRADSMLRADGERCLIPRADVIVGATDAERSDMECLYGRTPQQFEVIPPGVDLDLFRPHARRQARACLGIAAQRVILFVGRFDRLKGVDVLLRSVRAIPAELRDGLRVILVGGHGPADRVDAERYRTLAARLGIGAIVEFHGHVDQDQLPLYYSAADITAMPSAYESFGMAALESMACQTPVVAFRVGGLATTIQDDRTGYLATPGRADEYGARLLDALLDARRQEIGRRARFAVRDYTWDNTVRRTTALYDDIVRTLGYVTGTSVPTGS